MSIVVEFQPCQITLFLSLSLFLFFMHLRSRSGCHRNSVSTITWKWEINSLVCPCFLTRTACVCRAVPHVTATGLTFHVGFLFLITSRKLVGGDDLVYAAHLSRLDLRHHETALPEPLIGSAHPPPYRLTDMLTACIHSYTSHALRHCIHTNLCMFTFINIIAALNITLRLCSFHPLSHCFEVFSCHTQHYSDWIALH